jgi:transcriptional regulator with XRE-family HTH domain
MAWAQAPFADELPRLLAERGISVREVARRVDVDDAHLNRVLRGTHSKRITPQLASRIALSLGLNEDYFGETREGAVIEAIRRDPDLRDRIYDELGLGSP